MNLADVDSIASELSRLGISEGDRRRMARDLVAISQWSDPTRNLPIVETVRRVVYDAIHGTDYSKPDMEIKESASGWVTTATYRPLPGGKA